MVDSSPEPKPKPDGSDPKTDAPDRHFDTAHLKADLGRHTVRGAAWMFGTHGVRFALETGRIIVLARLLLPADYGLVAMVTVVTGLIAVFQDLGLNMATVTREKITHDQVSTLFWVNVAVGSVLVAATAAVAPLLAWFYDDPRLVLITFALAPTFLLAGLSVQHQALLRRQMRFGLLGGIRIFSVAMGLVAAITLAYQGAGYWALVAMTVVSAVASAIAAWIASGWRPGRPVRGSGARDMVSFGMNVTASNVVTYATRRLDHVLIGWWWGATALGLYTKANSLVEVPMNRALTPLGSVVVPSLSRLSEDPARYRDFYLRILEKLALLMMPVAVFMIAGGEWLIEFLLGPTWADSAPIFVILAVLGLLQPLEGSGTWLFVTQNRADEALRWSLIGGGVTAVAAGIGVPWGAVGVASALALSSVLRMPLLIWFVTRTGPVRGSDIYRTLATPLLASGVAWLAMLALTPYAADREPALVVLAGMAVTASVVLLVLLALPSGRRALQDAWSSLELLRSSNAA